jgi:molecular chaperone HtpG
MSEQNKIPFSIEISRVIELLASQIYPTPFAFLRENVQNSYDAILQRMHKGDNFNPKIDINISNSTITVSDNGLGMTRSDLTTHYWRAGSSSKNTPEAQAAGVVGTFGIGAMANFGIAETLDVETESAIDGSRTKSGASRSTLSVTEECITLDTVEPTGLPGTTVSAIMQQNKSIDIIKAETYITEFVKYLSIEVTVNGKAVSKTPILSAIPELQESWSYKGAAVDLGDSIFADIRISGAISGDLRVEVSKIKLGLQALPGEMVLRQGLASLQTLRSGFGLATTSVPSFYSFGGIANFLFLQPTAGREALTIESIGLLQRLFRGIDNLVSLKIAERPESNSNQHFVNWASRVGRYDLCSFLRVKLIPGDSAALKDLKSTANSKPLLVYHGNDGSIMEHASEDRPLIMITKSSPRRECEMGYLRLYCVVEELSDNPRIIKSLTNAEVGPGASALVYKIESILEVDYFLKVKVRFGNITHGLPILVDRTAQPIEICLDPKGSTVRMMLDVYENEYGAFPHMVKDAVRNVIFQKVADLVPSSTRQGAEAFLKMINRSREVFEYDNEDIDDLRLIWDEHLKGNISFQQASEKARNLVVKSFQTVDVSTTAQVRDIVPDVLDNAKVIQQPEISTGPLPAIERLDVSTNKKILIIPQDQQALKGYRCFLAITEKIKNERGEFFLQPHKTSIVWGGQKALFIFEHHSGEFGLYYDLQTMGLISETSGGGTFETCTIFMKNRIFIPVPIEIEKSFIPDAHEKKRFEVKCDILYIDK